MSSLLYTVSNKRLWDFSNPAAGTAQYQEIIVQKAISCHQWREATLLLRYHSTLNTWISGQQIDCILRMEAFCDEDPSPSTDFVVGPSPTYDAGTATINYTGSSTAPQLITAACGLSGGAGKFGSFLRVVLKGTQPAGTPGNNQLLQVYLSIDLAFKA